MRQTLLYQSSSGISQTGLSASSSPDVNTLPEFLASMNTHLLATIPFSTRQHPNCFHVQLSLFSDIRQNQIYRKVCSLVANIIVDHDKWRSSFEGPSTFEDHQGQL